MMKYLGGLLVLLYTAVNVLNLSRFPDAKHLASWAGMCPGNHESAGCPLGDAPGRQDPQGQHVAAARPHRGGMRRGADQAVGAHRSGRS